MVTCMYPIDPAADDGSHESTIFQEMDDDVMRYEIAIQSISSSLDGGHGVVEGVVEVVEYLNDDCVSQVTLTSSAIVEANTPLSLIEDRLLKSTREAVTRLAGLSDTDWRFALDKTKKDRDEADQDQEEVRAPELRDRQAEGEDIEGLTPGHAERGNYDATRDPRTGRPPPPLEAQRVARKRRDEEYSKGEASETSSESFKALEENGQQPARMVSLQTDEDEKSALDALVREGITRERAQALVSAHGTNLETLKAAAFAMEHSRSEAERKRALSEHHMHGIPPFEIPERN
jgi:hypothetical protein